MTLSLSRRKGWSGSTLCAGFVLVMGCGSPGDEAGDVGTEADAYRGQRGAERGHGAGKGAAHGKGGKSQGKGQGKGQGQGKGHGKGHGHDHDDDCDHGSSVGGTGSGTGSAGTTSAAGTGTSGGSTGSGQAGSFGTPASGGSSYAGTGNAMGGYGGGFDGGYGGGFGYPGVCGDGIPNGYFEQCDDGNTEGGDGCSAECTVEAGYYCEYGVVCLLAVCGNGLVQMYADGYGGWSHEDCDDGNSESGDGCNATCRLEPGYACYFGGSPCREVVCGDGVIDSYWHQDGYWTWEGCDDGNDLAGDGCSSECQIEPGHVCGDDGACHPVVCGDGLQESYFVPGGEHGTGGSGFAGAGGYGGGSSGYYAYEQCDDANTASGDGCSEACEVEPNYVCDSPGTPCRIPACGDGFRDWVPGPAPGGGWGGGAGSGGTVIFAGAGGTSGSGGPMHVEACDDGNLTSGDGCNGECGAEAGYTCDVAGQPCKLAVCGDGYHDWPYEQCDDGNTTSGDGCSSTCVYEWSGTGGSAGAWSGTGGSGVTAGWGGSG
jgi:cysteine-rich repeat protein